MIRVLRVALLSLSFLGLITTGTPALAQPQASFSRLVSKLRWRSIGPSIGGRVVAVSGVAQQPNVFYMGAVGGGIWKSDDYGANWKNISDKALHSASSSIGALAVAPSDPNVIYAGTGEADIRNDFITGDGVYKSTDAGKTWNYIGLKDTHTISDIVVDPGNSAVVYAASLGHVFVPNDQGGVYKTTDGGKTWNKVLFVNDQTGAIDLALDRQNPQVVYAAMWQVSRTPWKLTSGGPGSGLYKSTDGGAHWTNITHNPGLPPGIQGRIGVAVAPSQPDVVYAIVQAEGGGLFRSADAGRTWTRVNDNWELRQRGFYYSTVYVDPKDPDTVYLPEVDALWVSYDGGRKIGKLNPPHGDNHVAWINPGNPQIILEGNDGGATVSVNGGRSWSREDNQPTGEFYHANLDEQFPFHVYGAQQDEGSYEGPSSMFGGGIPLAAWKEVAGGEGTWVVPQPGKPWISYGGGYNMLLNRGDRRADTTHDISPWPDYQSSAASDELKYRLSWTHPILFPESNPQELLVGAQCVLQSLDYGETWACISPDLTRDDKSTEGPTGGPVMLDETGAEVYPYISGLAVSPLDAKIIWTGSSDGLVHITTDGGQHWSSITPPQLPQWADVSSIATSYTDKGTAYLTASRYMWDDFKPYVFKTTDYGQHWTEITRGLPDDDYVMSVALDPRSPNLLFLGVKNTVYVSVNGGRSWEPLSLNLPHVQVRSVAIQPEQGSVVIATHGRAFWVLDNLALLEQLADGVTVAQDSAHLFQPAATWLTSSYGTDGIITPSPSVGENHAFGASIFFHVPADYDGKTPVTLEFTTATGKVVNSYKLHLQAKTGKTPEAPAAPAATTSATTAMVSAAEQAKAEAEATAITPGMNLFQWDLRYPGSGKIDDLYTPPEATTGYYLISRGYDPGRPGPEVLPGTYYALLHYGDRTERAAFEVKLDPRLTATPTELQARQQLLFRITATLNTLVASVNRALTLQNQLERTLAAQPRAAARAQQALTNLQRAIGVLVQMHMRPSVEGDVTIEPALRDRLAALFNTVDLSYAQPRKLDYDVYTALQSQIQAGMRALAAADQAAQSVLTRQ